MKKKTTTALKDSKLARALKRILGEQCGAVAMEYIVIALLIGAAVVALVMVLSGSLRNAGSTINKTVNSGTVDEVKKVSDDHKDQRTTLGTTQNSTANQAGDQVGGDFSTK